MSKKHPTDTLLDEGALPAPEAPPPADMAAIDAPPADPLPSEPPPPPPPPAGDWRTWPKDAKDAPLGMGQIVRRAVSKMEDKVVYAYAVVAGGHGMQADRPGQPIFVTNVADTPEGVEVAGKGAQWTTAMGLQVQEVVE